jgi:ubiquinone/menaquinone biosynthesis C-methylase UbiE
MKKHYDDKQEAIKQWTHDPCGISRAKGLEIYSREFYEKVDESRYVEYAPWMKSTLEFEIFPGKKVLDVGFGMGTDLFQFASAGSIVSGIDLSPKHLEIAKKRFQLYNIDAELMLADAENMPFDNDTFDVVYSFGVIHHSPDIQKAINEICRVLKPDGRAIIGVYHKYSAYYLFSFLSRHFLRLGFLRESYRRSLSRIEHRKNSDACPLVRLYSRKKLLAMLREFSDVRIECVHLKRSHFGPFKKLVTSHGLHKLKNRLGWYLIAKCIK